MAAPLGFMDIKKSLVRPQDKHKLINCKVCVCRHRGVCICVKEGASVHVFGDALAVAAGYCFF